MILQQIKIPLIITMIILFAMVLIYIPSAPEITIPSNSGGTYLQLDNELLVANATIIEVVSGHAWQEHGTEVNDAIRCLNNKGSSMSFKTFGFKDWSGKDLFTNLWLCQDGDNWYAIVTTTLQKMGGNRVGKLVTAYLIDRKLFPNVGDFVLKVKELWGAIETSFRIEAGSVFLAPR